jgi:hypothetical protein
MITSLKRTTAFLNTNCPFMCGNSFHHLDRCQQEYLSNDLPFLEAFKPIPQHVALQNVKCVDKIPWSNLLCSKCSSCTITKITETCDVMEVMSNPDECIQ